MLYHKFPEHCIGSPKLLRVINLNYFQDNPISKQDSRASANEVYNINHRTAHLRQTFTPFEFAACQILFLLHLKLHMALNPSREQLSCTRSLSQSWSIQYNLSFHVQHLCASSDFHRLHPANTSHLNDLFFQYSSFAFATCHAPRYYFRRI
ncbi:hypothetical protein EDB19DRAFT_1727016, partial [Suillus lakei]